MVDVPPFADPNSAAIAGMSGLDLLRAMIAGRFSGPSMAERLHFRLAHVEAGLARFEGAPGADILNPLGTVHGGWALTLIDSAAGCAVHSTLPAGVGYTTVETKVNFTRPIRPDSGTYMCEGRVLNAGAQIALAEASLTAPDGRLVAHGTSTLIILRPRGPA